MSQKEIQIEQELVLLKQALAAAQEELRIEKQRNEIKSAVVRENERLTKACYRLREGIKAVNSLINESHGVAGLHLNGAGANEEDRMREICVRAWDGKEMIYDIASAFNDENPRLYPGIGHDGEVYVGIHNEHGDWQELPLMLFTGLYDKNGKEIWENDLYALDEGLYQIVWNQFWAGFFRKVIKPSDYEPCGDSIQPLHDTSGEVIGNIFENSELLKAEGE